jgi:mannosyltransferase
MARRCRRVGRVHRIAAVAVCSYLAFSIAVLTLDLQSIWWDEGISLHLAGLSWSGIVADRAANIHPPLYFLLLKAWTSLTGGSPFAGRTLSALAFCLLPAVVARFLGRRAGDRAARAGAFLVSLAPPFLVYGQEVRPYILLPLGVLGLWSLAWPAPRGPGFGRRRWALRGVLLGVTQSVLLLTHYAGAIAAVTAAAIYGLHLVRRWEKRRALDDRAVAAGSSAHILYEWLLGAGVLLALVAPWALAVAGTGGSGITQQAGLDNALAVPVPAAYVAGMVGVFHTTGLPGALGDAALVRPTALLGFLILVSVTQSVRRTAARPSLHPSPGDGGLVAHAGRKGKPQALALGLAFWLIPFLSAPLLWRLSPQSHPRYLFPFVLGGWIVLAMLATRSTVSRSLRLALLAAGLSASLLGLRAYFAETFYARSDVRSVAAYLRTQARPGDVVIVPDTDWSLLTYDVGPATPWMAPAAFRWEADMPALIEATSRADRIYVLDYGRGAVDPSGGLRAALVWSGELATRSTFAGVHLESYDMREPLRPHVCQHALPACLAGGGPCVVGVTFQPEPVSGTALPVRLCWEGEGAGERYGVAVRLFGSDGVQIAEDSQMLVNHVGAPTDRWPVGDHDSYHLLPLPVGLLPSTYRLDVGFFDWVDPATDVRLVYQGDATASSLTLGEIRPEAAPWRDVSLYRPPSPLSAYMEQVSPWLRLEGARLDRSEVGPGELVYATTAWRLTAVPPHGVAPQVAMRQGGRVLASAAADEIGVGWPEGRPILIVSGLRVPPEAANGVAEVVVVIGNRSVTLGEVVVRTPAHLFTVPSIGYTVEAQAGDIATLVAADLTPPGSALTVGDPITLTLVWRARVGASATDLKVFTHLVSDGGQILAQHDAVPVAWSRPTAGWVTDEVLIDVHPMAWEALDYVGDARLVVGFYNATTGERVLWEDGEDAYVLPSAVEVRP